MPEGGSPRRYGSTVITFYEDEGERGTGSGE
jgi:hypothetical protein